MKYGISIALYWEKNVENVLSYKIDSKLDHSLFIVYSHENHSKKVLSDIKGRNHIIRPNTGADYGAAKEFFETKKNEFDRFVFLNDDILFVRNDWLDLFHKAFEMGADVVSPCVCMNHSKKKIPRGCYWSATSKFLQELPWPEPMTKNDSYEQEMNLLPTYMKKNNKKLFQVGNGDDLMFVPEYPPRQTECVYSHLQNGEIKQCPI